MSHEYSFYPELCSFTNMNVEIELVATFNYRPGEARTWTDPAVEEDLEITDIHASTEIDDPIEYDLAVAIADYYIKSEKDTDHLAIEILENKEDWK